MHRIRAAVNSYKHSHYGGLTPWLISWVTRKRSKDAWNSGIVAGAELCNHDCGLVDQKASHSMEFAWGSEAINVEQETTGILDSSHFRNAHVESLGQRVEKDSQEVQAAKETSGNLEFDPASWKNAEVASCPVWPSPIFYLLALSLPYHSLNTHL